MNLEERLIIIGKRIKSIRLEQNLTQAELAEKAGVSVSYLSRIENGRVNCKVYIICRIIITLGCGFETLD